MSTQLKEQISKALDTVMDPHMGVGMNDMGMVHSINVNAAGEVNVGLVFPCIGCPAWAVIQHNIKKTVGEVDGVQSVKVTIEWDSPWQREHMSDKAREHAQSHGYRI